MKIDDMAVWEAFAAVAKAGNFSKAATQLKLTNMDMPSGAGHDAAVMASLAPMAMLFIRSPGGISHHPDEAVLPGDVQAALDVMVAFLNRLAGEAP